MAYQNILYEKQDGIAYITFNRPQVYNALNQALMQESLDALSDAEADESVRVVILTGAGDRAFVSGADIRELQARNTVTELGPTSRLRRRVAFTLENMPKPTIAAVNGYALGGGCEIALACALRIASENARFGQPEINLGILPGLGGTQRLTRLVGSTKAMEMILTGEPIDAQEAYRIGLVNKVVPQAQLMEAARELANKLTSKSPLALQLAKDAVNLGGNMGLNEALEFENRLFAILCGSQDKAEGVAAFLEKRKPVFKGQ